jgi:Integrase core domain
LPCDGATIIRTPLYTPVANAYAERWVGTVRRELHRSLIWHHRQFEQLLDEYVERYNTYWPHRSLGQRVPNETEVVAYRPAYRSDDTQADDAVEDVERHHVHGQARACARIYNRASASLTSQLSCSAIIPLA